MRRKTEKLPFYGAFFIEFIDENRLITSYKYALVTGLRLSLLCDKANTIIAESERLCSFFVNR